MSQQYSSKYKRHKPRGGDKKFVGVDYVPVTSKELKNARQARSSGWWSHRAR